MTSPVVAIVMPTKELSADIEYTAHGGKIVLSHGLLLWAWLRWLSCISSSVPNVLLLPIPSKARST